jgi:hypothetical protein
MIWWNSLSLQRIFRKGPTWAGPNTDEDGWEILSQFVPKRVCKTPKLFQCLKLIETMPGVSQMLTIIFQGSSSIAMLPGRQAVHLSTRCNNFLCSIQSYCLNKNASDRAPRALESGFGPQWKVFFGPPTKGVPARGKLRAKQRAS